MGACFNSVSTDGQKTATELKSWFKNYCDTCAYENGHSYSGQLNMCSGLTISSQIFEDEMKAEDWLSDHTEKWGPAVAVKTKTLWVIGGMCAS